MIRKSNQRGDRITITAECSEIATVYNFSVSSKMLNLLDQVEFAFSKQSQIAKVVEKEIANYDNLLIEIGSNLILCNQI